MATVFGALSESEFWAVVLLPVFLTLHDASESSRAGRMMLNVFIRAKVSVFGSNRLLPTLLFTMLLRNIIMALNWSIL